MARRQFTYTVLFEHDPETGYVCATVPVLDLATHGRTLDEARSMIREALELHLEGMLEENVPIPPDADPVERVTVEVEAPSSKAASP